MNGMNGYRVHTSVVQCFVCVKKRHQNVCPQFIGKPTQRGVIYDVGSHGIQLYVWQSVCNLSFPDLLEQNLKILMEGFCG